MQHYAGNYDTQAANMSMRRTKIRSSTAQMNAMVKYMTKGAQSHKDELDPSIDVPELGDQEWERLAETLNKIGPAVKNVAAWKVSWRDLKRTARMKHPDKVASTDHVQSFFSDDVIPPEVADSVQPDRVYYGSRKMRSSNAQISTMVDYMASNKKFARGQFSSPQERRGQEQEWVRLASLLNEMGPAVKNVAAWRVTWRDLTRNTRKKQFRTDATAAIAGKIEDIFRATGGAPVEPNDNTAEDSNDISQEQLSAPPSHEGSDAEGNGSEPEGGPSELDSPEASEDETDSSPCTSPTPEDDSVNGKTRCTSEQTKALVDCMSINRCMAFGKQDSAEKAEDWRHLRQLLNRLGPPKRTAEWRKHWRMLKKTSVLKSKAKAKCGMKIPDITKKIVDIVEAHREGQPNELEEESEEEFDMIPLRALSPQVNLTLPDLDPNEEPQTRQSPTDQIRNDRMSPVHNISQEDVTMENSQESLMQDGNEHVSEFFQWNKTDEKKAKRRCTNTQITALVKYMSAHPDLAVPGYSSPHANAAREVKWRHLTKHLNTLGTAKSTDGWKRTWRDLKLTVRCKRRKLTKTSMYLYRKVQDIIESNATEGEGLPEFPEDTEPSHQPQYLTSPDLENRSNDVIQESNQSPVQHSSAQVSPSGQVANHSSSQAYASEKGDSSVDSDAEMMQRTSGNDKGLRCTKPQMNALVNYMSNHPKLAKSRISYGVATNAGYAVWRQLTKYLNKLGPAKSTSGWKNTWKYLRVNARRHDRRASVLSRKILGILGEETPNGDDSDQPVKEPTENDMSALHLNSPSPLPGYCKTRPTNTQIYALVSYISKHPGLESCYTSVDAHDPNLTEWRLLARYLNRLGTAKKNTVSWKRTWRDLKSSVVRNRRTPSPWSDKITEKVIEILDKTNDEPCQTNDETVNQLSLPCPTEGTPVLFIPSPHVPEIKPEPMPDPLREQPRIKTEPTLDPLHCDQEPNSHEQNQKEPKSVSKFVINIPNISQISRQMSVKSSRIKSPEREHSVNSSQMSPEHSQSSRSSNLGDNNYDQNDDRETTVDDDFSRDGSQQWNKAAKKTRCTNLQLRALTDYMCDHPDMALYNLNSKDAIAEWRHLTRQLNRMGTADKSTTAWKRTWRDIKKAVRRGKMGGGLDKARERKVRTLLGFETGTESQNVENNTETPMEPPSSPAPDESPLVSIQRCVEMLTKSSDDKWTTERKKGNASATTGTDASETNSLLKELVSELQRSNQLKAEQNIYLRELLKQVSTLTPPKEDDGVTQNNGSASKFIQKQEDVTVDECNIEGTFCAEDYCVAQLNTASNKEESQSTATLREVTEQASPLVRPVSLSSLMTTTIPNQVDMRAVKLKTFSRSSLTDVQAMPNVSIVRLKVISRKGRPKKYQTKEEILRQKRIAERLRYEKLKNDPTKLKEMKEKEKRKYQMRKEKGQVKLVGDMDGTMVLVPGSKLPVAEAGPNQNKNDNRIFVVGNAKQVTVKRPEN